MSEQPPIEGQALVYCEGAFGTPNGKTAHGLVRRTERYRVVGVIDSLCAGRDAGEVLEGRRREIPIYPDLGAALVACQAAGTPATHFVIGLAPDGGRMPPSARPVLRQAIGAGLHVDSGLHDFISEDIELVQLADEHGVRLRDIRKPPRRELLHGFSGEIEQVRALKVAVLGTDSAVGKRTTAWMLVDGLRQRGVRTELIGTGQTAWMQGVAHGVILDSLVNDFVAGEIEHAIVSCYREREPQAIVIEGQGSLMNPAYPGGHEILAAGRPDAIVLQHAPGRSDYDGFPGHPIHPLKRQIRAVELLSDRPVVAVAVNDEGLTTDECAAACREIRMEYGLPACNPLTEGTTALLEPIIARISRKQR